MKNLISFLLIFLLFSQHLSGFCIDASNQKIEITLPQVYEIENVIVKGVEHNRDKKLFNMKIENIDKINNNQHILTLSPVSVKLKTNAISPIVVYADFEELKHVDGNCNFNKNNLSISPTSYTIDEPYNHVITGDFTPYVKVTPEILKGIYKGTLIFTLGAMWRNLL